MKLKDLLPVIDENTDVAVIMNGTEVARYDGKNSIPEELDDVDVIKQSVSAGILNIEVKSTPITPVNRTLYCWAEPEEPLPESKNGSYDTWYRSAGPFHITVDGVEHTIGYDSITALYPASAKETQGTVCVAFSKPSRMYHEGFNALTYDALSRGEVSIDETRLAAVCLAATRGVVKIKRPSKVTLDEMILKFKAQPETGRKE